MTAPALSEPELMTLAEAAQRLHAKVTVSSLREARKQGRLWAVKIGKRYFTTWPAVLEFLQCPAPENLPACSIEKTKDNGSSVMAPPCAGQDMALASASRLKRHCKNTLQTESHQTAMVQPIRGN